MASSGRRRKRDTSKDVGEQLLLSFGLLECLLPIDGSELEQTIARPAADQAEQVADVTVGFDAVKPSAGEQRDEDGVYGGAVVAADEEPVSTTEDLPAQIQLADVVVCREPPVVQEPTQGDALVACIPECGLNGRLIEHPRKLGVAPVEELVDDGAALVASYPLFLFSGRVRDGPLDGEQSTNVQAGTVCSG